MRVALRGKRWFCPEAHTTYGVVKGRLSEGSLDVPPETIRRRRPDGARSVWIFSTMPSLQIRDLPETLPRLLENAPPDQVHAGLDDRHYTEAGGGVCKQNCPLRWLNGHFSDPLPRPMPGVDPPGGKWRRGGGNHPPWQDRGKAHPPHRRAFAKPAALGEIAGIRSVGDCPSPPMTGPSRPAV